MTEKDAKRLEKISQKLEQIKAQKNDIIARDKARQRKERTRRLIQLGALAEKYFDCKDIEPSEIERLLKRLFSQNSMRDYIDKLKQQISEIKHEI